MSISHGTVLQHNHHHHHNNRIYIAPYGRNFRGAGGRSDQCSVKAWVNKTVLSLELKTDICWSELFVAASSRQCWKSESTPGACSSSFLHRTISMYSNMLALCCAAAYTHKVLLPSPTVGHLSNLIALTQMVWTYAADTHTHIHTNHSVLRVADGRGWYTID